MAVTPQLSPNEFDDACLAAVLKESDGAEQAPGSTEVLAEFVSTPAPAPAVALEASVEPPAARASGAKGSGHRDIREQIENLNGALRGAREELAERDRTRQAAEADRDGQLAELRLQVAHTDEVRRQLVDTQELLSAMQTELAERDEREADLRRTLQERDDEMARLRDAFDALKGDTGRLLSEISSSLGRMS